MSNSVQHKISRVRPPRVHITYDVETGGAMRKKEVPFVVGVLAPLAGMSTKQAYGLRERQFVDIDRDNFDAVMASLEPAVQISVPNTLSDDGSMLSTSLTFSKFEEFDPVAVLRQVSELNEVYEARSRLRDMMAKLDGNDELGDELAAMLTDKDRRKAFVDVFLEARDAILAAREIAVSNDREAALLAAIPSDAMEANTDLGKLLSGSRMVLEASQVPYAISLLEEFVSSVVSQQSEDSLVDPTAVSFIVLITHAIAIKDGQISRQLNYVLHSEELQALEATWRGLHYLIMNTETSSTLKVRVLNATFDELYKDLDKAVEFDQSALYKLIYEQEFGTFGGEPYSVLIGDYQIGRSSRDLTFIERISQVAAAAHAPFISSAYSKLFDIQDFDELHKPRDLTKIFDSAELTKWRAFRETEDSRYVTLTLPKVLLRLPFHHEDNPVEGIFFDEDVAVTLLETDEDGNVMLSKNGQGIPMTTLDPRGVTVEKVAKKVDSSKMLWGNPAFVLARVITNAFATYGWTAAIRGVDGGGLVEGLPAYTFETEDGDVKLNCPTQVSITDRREKELNDLGFMAICHCKGTDKAAFFGGQTTNKAKQYLTESANRNAQTSAMLPYMLASSRFAHYIKVMMRERVGTFMSRDQIQTYLSNWIAQYVLLDDSAPQGTKARYPLREAKVQVVEVEGRIGAYSATVFLRPHFQLEELTASIRLVAQLP